MSYLPRRYKSSCCLFRIWNFFGEMVKRMRRGGEMEHRRKMKGDIHGMEYMGLHECRCWRCHSSLGGIQVCPVQPGVSCKAMSEVMGLHVAGVLSCSVELMQQYAVTHLQCTCSPGLCKLTCNCGFWQLCIALLLPLCSLWNFLVCVWLQSCYLLSLTSSTVQDTWPLCSEFFLPQLPQHQLLIPLRQLSGKWSI